MSGRCALARGRAGGIAMGHHALRDRDRAAGVRLPAWFGPRRVEIERIREGPGAQRVAIAMLREGLGWQLGGDRDASGSVWAPTQSR